jgi:sigma54-dependent transcription regulator
MRGTIIGSSCKVIRMSVRPAACCSIVPANGKKIANDADRLRKYLARFDLEWGELKERFRQN